MQSLTGKVTGDSLTAVEWNQLPQEVQNIITDLGISLSSGDLNQLGKAISGYVANGVFYTDSGAADAYVLSVIGTKQAPPAYTDGFEVVFIAGNTNTGASTINVAGLGVKDIKTVAGGDPGAGDITAGDYIGLRYDNANGWFDYVSLAEFSAATQSDLETGTSTTTFTSPGRQQFHASAAKAWVNFNGDGTVAIRDSYNVSSITDNGTGNYTVNFTTSMSSADYAVVIASNTNDTSPSMTQGGNAPFSLATGSYRIGCHSTSTGTPADHILVNSAAFGDQ